MNSKQYVLSDGTKYIKINPQGDPVKTPNIAFANVFPNAIEANTYLHSPQMTKLNKDGGKNRFTLEEYEEYFEVKTSEDKQLEEDILKEIDDLDGTYKDYEGIRLPDKSNTHVYSGKTYMEEDSFDFYEFMKTAIKVFSQLESFNENMAYLEQEIDLKLLDIRHYKRDENTRLNAITAQQLEFLEQDLERERIKYKRNRVMSGLFVKDIKRIKNKTFLKILHNVANGDYKYRRINKGEIEEMIKNRKSGLKAV